MGESIVCNYFQDMNLKTFFFLRFSRSRASFPTSKGTPNEATHQHPSVQLPSAEGGGSLAPSQCCRYSSRDAGCSARSFLLMCFALAFMFREGRGISLSGDIQNPPGLVPVLPAPGDPALKGVWAARSPEVPSSPNDSVILCFMHKRCSWKDTLITA